MRCVLLVLLVSSPMVLGGCLGAFASNQARRQAARSADYYVRTYAEPELNEFQGTSPEARAQSRQLRNDIADTIVRTGNDRYDTRVGVNERGYIVNVP